jgi:hypothetical protein
MRWSPVGAPAPTVTVPLIDVFVTFVTVKVTWLGPLTPAFGLVRKPSPVIVYGTDVPRVTFAGVIDVTVGTRVARV